MWKERAYTAWLSQRVTALNGWQSPATKAQYTSFHCSKRQPRPPIPRALESWSKKIARPKIRCQRYPLSAYALSPYLDPYCIRHEIE